MAVLARTLVHAVGLLAVAHIMDAAMGAPWVFGQEVTFALAAAGATNGNRPLLLLVLFGAAARWPTMLSTWTLPLAAGLFLGYVTRRLTVSHQPEVSNARPAQPLPVQPDPRRVPRPAPLGDSR